MWGCFARWLSGERGGKRAVKHGRSGLRAAIYALFGTLRGDLCKTVEKLCKSLQGVKTKITNCAQRFVRLCVLVRELCKYRFLSAFGVWAVRCGGAPFGRFPSRLRRRGAHLGGGGAAVDKLPRGERTGRGGLLCEGASAFAFALPHPALGASPISGRGRGRRQVAAGRAHGQGRGLPCALPPLRTAVRPSAGRGAAVGRLPRGERTDRGGVALVHSAFAHSDSAHKRHGSALREGASAFAFALPHPAHGGAGHGATTAWTLFQSDAYTPREQPTGERYLYIRVRRREGENVLHRPAGNDVDNFSVDNPLWITAAAGGRLLRGGSGRLCGGSVNADGGSVNAGAEVQTRTGRVRKPSRAMGTRRGRLSAPWLRFHGADRADVYIIIRVRACCCGECALNPPTSPPIPAEDLRSPPHSDTPFPSTSAPPRSPDARLQAARCIPRSPHNSFPAEDLARPRTAHTLPEHFRSPTQSRRTPAGCAMHSPPTAQLTPRRRPSPAPHSDTPFPSTSAPPRSADARPQAARCTPADRTTHYPQRHAASPSVPLRAQKNGTAQCMCDAECLGRPSLRSVIWVGEPRAVRRRCGALACRRGA